ncbi:hypothetical protein L1987_40947 [Smallanthus sonchifolius]|uniref:Uncharacterized protein n=1 Tax=Smallanthus sonchifolius TaxID=185202 RepID=A0ACB9GUK1_9ASTR|nr:hypothetical protein L1987_40947 [Smallanthus sonchifolius]
MLVFVSGNLQLAGEQHALRFSQNLGFRLWIDILIKQSGALDFVLRLQLQIYNGCSTISYSVQFLVKLFSWSHLPIDGPMKASCVPTVVASIMTLTRLLENMLSLILVLSAYHNLSVTSTLTISTDPYPPSLITAPNGLNKVTDVPNPNPQLQSDISMENGALPVPVAADRNAIMTLIEERAFS